MSDPSGPEPQSPPQPPLAAPLAPPLAQRYAPPVPPPAPPKRPGWLIPLAIGGSVLVTGAMLAATVFLVIPAASEAKPGSSASQATGDDTIAEGEDGRRIFGPNDPVLEGEGTITEQLEALKVSYQTQAEDGSLWELIPKTNENLGAYQAFQMLLSDMKGATLFGTSETDNLYFSQEARHLEAQLLAEKPLGSSVTYTNSEGRTFEYNGDTGEVSFG